MNNKEDWISAIIIDDSDDELDDVKDNNTLKAINTTQQEEIEEIEEVIEITPINKKLKKKKIVEPLKYMFDTDTTIIEIGIDEAGRGPMFGRVYAGVAVLPKDDVFDHSQMKDSKKFTSKKKIENVAEYIKENAIAWAVEYEDEQIIDNINILQATQSAMHKGIKNVIAQLSNNKDIDYDKILLLVDGNYFKPFTILNKTKTKFECIKCQMIEGGDNKYTSIAADSILAKVSRDKYIEELCIQNPELIERYSIDSNKGYGSKKHMEGINKYGISKWHRKTFGICKQFA
jgi:ribonuclease HII